MFGVIISIAPWLGRKIEANGHLPGLVNMQKTIENHEFEYLHSLFSMWYSECHIPPAGLVATLWSGRDSPAFILP
jgi:hypothetical protein